MDSCEAARAFLAEHYREENQGGVLVFECEAWTPGKHREPERHMGEGKWHVSTLEPLS